MMPTEKQKKKTKREKDNGGEGKNKERKRIEIKQGERKEGREDRKSYPDKTKRWQR